VLFISLNSHFTSGFTRLRVEISDDVRKYIQKIKVPNWKTLAQDRRRWKELVEKAKTL